MSRPVTPLRLSRRLLSLPKRQRLTREQREFLHRSIVDLSVRTYCANIDGSNNPEAPAQAEEIWQRDFTDDPDAAFIEVEAVAMELIAALIDLVGASRRPMAPGSAKILDDSSGLGFTSDYPGEQCRYFALRERAEESIGVLNMMGDAFGGAA